jgi:hypothetical protein
MPGARSSRERNKPAGIREIAKSLDISIGTVDRRAPQPTRINEQTRRRILQRAKALGYRPNLAARFLVSQKQLRIGVNLPRRSRRSSTSCARESRKRAFSRDQPRESRPSLLPGWETAKRRRWRKRWRTTSTD